MTTFVTSGRQFAAVLLAFALLIGSAAPAFAQDDATPDVAGSDATPGASGGSLSIGEPVTVYTEAGNEIAQITIDEVIDPYDDFRDGFELEAGLRIIAITMTIENLVENDRFEYNTFDFSLLTQDGFLLGSSFLSLPDDTELVELESGEVLGGETASGTLFFGIDEASELNGLYFTDFGSLAQLADLSDGSIERPVVGDTVTIIREDGEDLAEITIDNIQDPYDEFSEFFSPDEGVRYLAVDVSIVNVVTNDGLEVSPFDFSIQTETGMLLGDAFVSLPDDTEIVELEDTDVLGGESISGTIFFAVPEDATVTGIYIQPENGQVFLLADPSQ